MQSTVAQYKRGCYNNITAKAVNSKTKQVKCRSKREYKMLMVMKMEIEVFLAQNNAKEAYIMGTIQHATWCKIFIKLQRIHFCLFSVTTL